MTFVLFDHYELSALNVYRFVVLTIASVITAVFVVVDTVSDIHKLKYQYCSAHSGAVYAEYAEYYLRGRAALRLKVILGLIPYINVLIPVFWWCRLILKGIVKFGLAANYGIRLIFKTLFTEYR
jgi:hypothetical protein